MNKDYESLLRGEALFIEDIIQSSSAYHIKIIQATISKGKIVEIDFKEALTVSGMIGIITAEQIQGENQIGGIIEDEPLLADGEVDYIGQPIGISVARTKESAKKGAEKVKITYKEEPGIFDARESAAKGELICPARTIQSGTIEEVWERCWKIAEGRVETGGQEHLYLETQGALAIPMDGGRITIHSATQSPTAVQRTAAKVLGKDMNEIEVDTRRLGGAFGGKEDQATAYACLAALASEIYHYPAALVLDRKEDMAITGKRHPYSADFRIGINKDLEILGYEAVYYQNAGVAADLSTAILERTLYHGINGYRIPNVKLTGYSCRTNYPPNTAFRGFGGPQAMFVMESAIAKAAEQAGVYPHEIQEKNLAQKGDMFHYGMKLKNKGCKPSYKKVIENSQFYQKLKVIEEFNRTSKIIKKGISVMPVCFGISFTTTFLNQAGALVHIYTDGSVSISSGAVDMGQGVNMKLQLIASKILGIPVEWISVESTNTRRVANTSPTAASTATDLNGGAVKTACEMLRKRLVQSASDEMNSSEKHIFIENGIVHEHNQPTELTWKKLIKKSYEKRIHLSAQAFYSTPDIYYDKTKERGQPFAYHVTGSAVTEVTLDCLRGIYDINQVYIVHDTGKSIAPAVDIGQIEGALVQGIGWVTIEELVYRDGRILTDSLATYKVPDIRFSPQIETEFIENEGGPSAVMKTKGVGEPPFMYGIGTYFAVLQGIKSFTGKKGFYSAPITNEKVLCSLYPQEDINVQI